MYPRPLTYVQSTYHKAGTLLIRALTKNRIIRTVGGRMAEELVYDISDNFYSIRDRNQAFTLAVDYVLQNGGEVNRIVESAENACLDILKENRTSLDIIARKLINGRILSDDEVVQIINSQIDWDWET